MVQATLGISQVSLRHASKKGAGDMYLWHSENKLEEKQFIFQIVVVSSLQAHTKLFHKSRRYFCVKTCAGIFMFQEQTNPLR